MKKTGFGNFTKRDNEVTFPSKGLGAGELPPQYTSLPALCVCISVCLSAFVRALLADINSCTSKQTGEKAHIIEASANRRHIGWMECVIFCQVIFKVCDVRREAGMKSLCHLLNPHRPGFIKAPWSRCPSGRPCRLC